MFIGHLISVINLTMNLDGIPPFKSAKELMRPILFSCNIISITVFVSIMTYGIKSGITKPKNYEFLRETVDELKHLLKNGIFTKN